MVRMSWRCVGNEKRGVEEEVCLKEWENGYMPGVFMRISGLSLSLLPRIPREKSGKQRSRVLHAVLGCSSLFLALGSDRPEKACTSLDISLCVRTLMVCFQPTSPKECFGNMGRAMHGAQV